MLQGMRGWGEREGNCEKIRTYEDEKQEKILPFNFHIAKVEFFRRGVTWDRRNELIVVP